MAYMLNSTGGIMRSLRVSALVVGSLALLVTGCGQSSQKAGSILSSTARRVSPAAAVVDNKLYVVGGLESSGNSSVVEEYDVATNEWRARAPLPTPRSDLYAAALNGQIYITGGRDERSALDVCEKYDPASDSWSQCPGMTTARWRHVSAVLGEKLYVFGGIAGIGDARRVLDSVEVFDPVANTWSVAPSMPMGRSGMASVSVGSKLYLIGGKTEAGPNAYPTSRVDVFDGETDQWLPAPPLPEARVSACAAEVEERIYVIAGSTSDITGSVVVFDPATDAWTQAATSIAQRAGHVCATVGETVFVIAGMTDRSPTSMTNEMIRYRPVGDAK